MNTENKWYNEPQMVGTLLIFWPPLGIYGLYKSETIQPAWKNITYGTVAVMGVLLALSLFV